MLTFSYEDLIGIQISYDDPFVVLIIIANYEVRKVLVDNRSVVDILFYDPFMTIKLPTDKLTPL